MCTCHAAPAPSPWSTAAAGATEERVKCWHAALGWWTSRLRRPAPRARERSALAPQLAGLCDRNSAGPRHIRVLQHQAPLRGAPTASRPNHSLPAAACQYTSAHGPRSADTTSTTRPPGVSAAGDSAARALSKAAPSFWPSSTARPPKTSPEPQVCNSEMGFGSCLDALCSLRCAHR